MKLICLILLLVAASCAQQETENYEIARTICGRTLAEARMVLCFALEENNTKQFSVLYEEFSSFGSPKFVPKKVLNETDISSRKKRGIAWDCCLNPCTINDLLSYC